MTNRQHVAFRHVLDIPGSSVRTQKLERSYLLALFEKSAPALRDDRPNFGNRKIFQAAADDFFTRHAQQLTGADARLPVAAIVIGNEDGRGGMEYYGTEQQLK